MIFILLQICIFHDINDMDHNYIEARRKNFCGALLI